MSYHKEYPRHKSIYNSNFVGSILLVIVVPLLIAAFSAHNFLTYLSDHLEHLYSLRELSQLVQIFLQGIILALSLETYYTVFLIVV